MIEEVFKHIKNYFITETHSGSYKISSGKLTNASFLTGGYYLIDGSQYNDGVHYYSDTLTDEDFSGDIAILNPPEEFLELYKDIEAYVSSDMASPSPFKKESFGGYTYERDDTGSLSWQKAFGSRLNQWRKI
ncbi:MAG: hypothetical protein LUC38_07370 [Oscillospiraceae bacterium]|nr:hypothetical protein [Ruminococcus sp.]MCD8345762.1 hypothetical protein [Oscillospiraceae bacterium]